MSLIRVPFEYSGIGQRVHASGAQLRAAISSPALQGSVSHNSEQMALARGNFGNRLLAAVRRAPGYMRE